LKFIFGYCKRFSKNKIIKNILNNKIFKSIKSHTEHVSVINMVQNTQCSFLKFSSDHCQSYKGLNNDTFLSIIGTGAAVSSKILNFCN
jgi:hypothetical protein